MSSAKFFLAKFSIFLVIMNNTSAKFDFHFWQHKIKMCRKNHGFRTFKKSVCKIFVQNIQVYLIFFFSRCPSYGPMDLRKNIGTMIFPKFYWSRIICSKLLFINLQIKIGLKKTRLATSKRNFSKFLPYKSLILISLATIWRLSYYWRLSYRKTLKLWDSLIFMADYMQDIIKDLARNLFRELGKLKKTILKDSVSLFCHNFNVKESQVLNSTVISHEIQDS